MKTNKAKTISKVFLEIKFDYLKNHGQEVNIETIIQNANISAEAKELLLWRFKEGLLIKQIGKRLQEKLQLTEPLSDRQVDRRMLKACNLLFDTLVASC
ncbi:MAG: hypothetical protein J6Q39_03980 [Bacteroidales bacterium]|jgi:predicted transcriptional regulator|nr:hypothetical protein [Bacteroidales bacterium]